ncbi:MAG: hypothetical protein GXO68_05735 [Crenarchaeota archaeon]|nr:hypothetical protein [Thermoproteota archaeon]
MSEILILLESLLIFSFTLLIIIAWQTLKADTDYIRSKVRRIESALEELEAKYYQLAREIQRIEKDLILISKRMEK